jgi:carbon-monoxide dehydrogenase medium subunit
MDKSRIVSGRLVVSAATAKAARLKAAERMLVDAEPDDRTFGRVAEAAAEEADIIADARGSASYKRELLRVYAARALSAALQANGGAV